MFPGLHLVYLRCSPIQLERRKATLSGCVDIFPSIAFSEMQCHLMRASPGLFLCYQSFPSLSLWGFISYFTSSTLPKFLDWMKMWNMTIPQIPNTGCWRSLVGTSPDSICYFYVSFQKSRGKLLECKHLQADKIKSTRGWRWANKRTDCWSDPTPTQGMERFPLM